VIRNQAEWWNATVSRDATADGRFVYAVVTTGIYCRPSCPTPTPLRRNVRFFPDSDAAEAAGFCACKRCRPTVASPFAWQIAAVDKACDILHRSEHAPSLATLAAAVGVSRFHFHRIFRAMLGVTPGEYASAVRWQRLAASLEAGRPVADAIYGSGYGSISRAYAKARQVLGMTPAARRAGGVGLEVRFAVVERGAGHVLVAATGEDVCVIELGGDPAALVARLRRHLPAAVIKRHAADATAALTDAVRRAELPPRALELQPEARDLAFRARVRKASRGCLDVRVPAKLIEPARSASDRSGAHWVCADGAAGRRLRAPRHEARFGWSTL
jgi:AraC family transcriptional regulator of adaptative response/methylated-DNA-[protein]-cysteine methyltransferase